MPNFFVLYWNPAKAPNGGYEPVVGPNSDATFTAINGTDAAGQAAVQDDRAGKYAALLVDAAPRAFLTTNFASANANFALVAKAVGVGGNNVAVQVVVAGNNTALSVGVVGNTITVNAATDGSGAATSTANAIIAAINGSGAASALVEASLAPGSDGTGVVPAMALSNLNVYGASATIVTLETVADTAATTF